MKICYSCFSKLPPGAKVCPRCGCSADLKNEEKYPHALPCGTVLNGRYIVGRVLGQGGFGITYAGQEFNSKKLVAIKEYFPDTMAVRGISSSSHTVTPLNADRSEEFEYGKEQFLREARTLSAFIGSPNIVRVYSFFEENGTAYFVMEYVRGKSLKQYVEGRGGRISWEEAWKLLMPVLEALSEVHSKKIIHRDIKPENIIITKGGRAKLIDFGAARYNYVEKSSSLTAILTPGYAPPEQYYRKGEQGPWTDIYALAATMYFCITGTPPSEAIERTYGDSLEKPSSLGISIPDYAEAALLKALALKKEERFQTTYDFRNEVLSKMEPLSDEDGGAPLPPPADPDKIIFTETRKKAVSGDPEAQFMLGYLYEMGKGARKDEKEAAKWYSKAAEQGNVAGKRSLDRLRLKDLPPEQPPEDSPGPGTAKAGQNVFVQPVQNHGEGGDSSRKGENGGQSADPSTEDRGGGQPSSSVNGKNGDDGPRSRTGRTLPGLILLAVTAAAVIVIALTNHFGVKDDSGGKDNAKSEEAGVVSDNSDDEEDPVSQDEINKGKEEETGESEEESVPDESYANINDTDIEIPGQEPAPTVPSRSDTPMALTDSWEQIIAASRDGSYRDRYRIGDTKELDMGSEGVITMKLVAMDEDELADGSGKAPMTWVADELLKSEHNMNYTDTNKGGWEASGMRAWLRETVLPLMPEEVRSGIKEVTKYSYSYEEQKGVTTTDTIWIPSAREVFLADDPDWVNDCYEKDGAAYTEVFKDDDSRVRGRAGASGASWWWLRSAIYYYDFSFIFVFSDGSYYSNGASREGGVVVGFCL